MAKMVVAGVQITVDGVPMPGSFTQHQEMIDATPMTENDPNWIHADTHGHEHRWMAGPDPLVPLTNPQQQTSVLPTLRYALDEPYWCGDCHDEHQFGHYECVFCGEWVSPGVRAFIGRNYIPGLMHIEVEVEEALRPIGGEVDVIVPTEPPTAFRGRIVSVDYRSGWGRARSCIEQVRAPREVNAPS